jgi:8-oxo-dGTP pyrophosphatase MutT (NUDIX family)
MHRRKTTAVIVEGDGGKFLGVARKNNHHSWGFGGGKCEKGESTILCAVRELEEETGLHATSMNLLDVRDYDYIIDSPEELVVHQDEVWLYRVNSYTGDILSNEELLEKGEAPVKWCTPEELVEGFFGDYNKAILEKVYGLSFEQDS